MGVDGLESEHPTTQEDWVAQEPAGSLHVLNDVGPAGCLAGFAGRLNLRRPVGVDPVNTARRVASRVRQAQRRSVDEVELVTVLPDERDGVSLDEVAGWKVC